MVIARKLMFTCGAVAALAVTASAQPPDGPDDDLTPPSAVMSEPVRVAPRVEKPNPLATTERWGGGVRLTGLSGIGALPGVNYGGEVAGLVRRDELFVELGLSRWKPEDTVMVTSMPEPVELALDIWTLRAGWSSMNMPLRGWLLVEVGEVAGTRGMPGVVSRMMMGDTPQERQWRAAGGGLGVAWPMSNHARVVGNLELAIPLGRERLMLDQGSPYEPDWMAARYSIGLEVGWR